MNIKFDRPIDPLDPILDSDRVISIARLHVHDASRVTQIDETGNQARAYVIDDTYVLKTQRPHKKAPRDLSPAATWPVVSYADLEKEWFLLAQLEQYAPGVKAPRALGYGRDADGEYVLMTRVPGVRMGELRIVGAQRSQLLFELGQQLRLLHSLPVEPLRQSAMFPGDRDSSDIRLRVNRLLRDGLEAAATQQITWGFDLESTAADILRTVDSAVIREPVVLHSNPSQDHVYVDPTTFELRGIIDFGDAYFSHPAIDTRRWRLAEDRNALMQGYTATSPLSASDCSLWRAILSTLQIREAAVRPAARAEALAALRDLL